MATCNNRSKCKREAAPNRKLCVYCIDQRMANRRKRRAEGFCQHCGAKPEAGFTSCERCRLARVARVQKRDARARAVIASYYGSACVCCGEDEPKFLTLDHVNGLQPGIDRSPIRKGAKRKHNQKVWRVRLAKLITDGTPRMDIRVLCFNCNSGRQINGGVCPHELKRKQVA